MKNCLQCFATCLILAALFIAGCGEPRPRRPMGPREAAQRARRCAVHRERLAARLAKTPQNPQLLAARQRVEAFCSGSLPPPLARRPQAPPPGVPAVPGAAGEDKEVSAEELERIVQSAVQAAMASSGKPEAKAEPRVRSDVDEPSYRRAEEADNLAVVVGIEGYEGLPKADYAERDAEAVRRHLLALGFAERNVVLMTGRQATRSGLVKNLESWLPNNVSERSLVVFYYSGHGAPDPATGEAYLVPADGDPQYLAETGYPMKRLYEKLGALKARQVLTMIDSCFSGAGGRSVLAKGTRPLVSMTDSPLPAGGKIVSLSASEAAQISGALDAQGHGLFTYYLLKGLNGEAADASGAVTLRGLYDYLNPKVQDSARRENRRQTPQLLPASDAAGVRLR